MYDELVKSLRFCAMTDLSEEEYPCDPCEYEAPEKYHIKNKVATLLDMDADGHYLTYSSIFGEVEEPAPPKEG